MSDLDNNLCFWNVGDTISANRLNQMVCKINTSIAYQNGINSGTDATNSGGKLSANKGKYDRHLHYMHTQDGVGKVIDSYVNTKCICDGIYARRTGVSGVSGVLYHPCNTNLTRISCIGDGIELYQKITTDNTGNPTNSEIVRIVAGESVPYPQMWQYAGESTATGGCGILYNRLSRTVVDCRVSDCVRAKSKKYTTIRTNDFFIPPVPQNATNEHNTLIKPMIGNTIPVRTLKPSCGITMASSCNCIEVELKKANSATSQLGGVYGITMDSAATNPSINNGQIVIPQVISGCSVTYTAGNAISCSDLANNKISVLPANSNNNQKGYVYSISTDSATCYPTIINGQIILPKYSKTSGGGNCYYAGQGLAMSGNCIYLREANSATSQLGGVYSIASDSSITSPCIDNGVIKIPSSTPSYCFDPNWFSICNGVITLNTTKLTGIAQEIAENTTVNVNVTGVLDSVATGEVVINTNGITCGNDVLTIVSICSNRSIQ